MMNFNKFYVKEIETLIKFVIKQPTINKIEVTKKHYKFKR